MKTGRNEPCPCGSGKKYKKCCMGSRAGAVQISAQNRAAALEKLARFAEVRFGAEEDDAMDELWGEWDDEGEDLDERLSEELRQALDDLFDPWFFFDRPLMDDRLVVDRFLADGPPLA